MSRHWKQVLLIAIVAILTAGCWMARPQVVAVTAVMRPGVGGPQPALQLPNIQLEYNGNTIQGIQLSYQWQAPNMSMGGGSGLVPSLSAFPGMLAAPAGQSVNIVLNYSNLPPAFIVVELDAQGAPLTSSVLKPTTATTPFQPTERGQHLLEVTAQWSFRQYITYLFAIEVQ